jgi:hypothetical protein
MATAGLPPSGLLIGASALKSKVNVRAPAGSGLNPDMGLTGRPEADI